MLQAYFQDYFEPVFEIHLYLVSGLKVYILDVDFQNLCIYCQTQKYT